MVCSSTFGRSAIDEFTLEPIDDEEEFDMVADAFDEILDEMEFNSMSEDD